MFRIFWVCVIIIFGHAHAYADIASTVYVNDAVESRVSTDVDAHQEMRGSYTVSGEIIVPTQPLPPSEVE